MPNEAGQHAGEHAGKGNSEELGEAKGLMMKGKVMLSKGKPEGKDLINMAFAKGKGKEKELGLLLGNGPPLGKGPPLRIDERPRDHRGRGDRIDPWDHPWVRPLGRAMDRLMG